MKIAFVTHTAYPDFIGGREHHIHNLASVLSETDDVTVIAGGKGQAVQKKALKGYKLITLPMISVKVSSNPLQIYRIIPKFFFTLKKENPDLIHAFEYGSYSTDIAYLYAKKYNIPLILTVYGYQFSSSFLKFLKKIYDHFLGRRLFAKAKAIFYPSNIQRREIIKIGKPNVKHKIVLQENCIRVNGYANIGRKESLLKEYGLGDELKLLTVARMLPRKGIRYLLFALHDIFKQHSWLKVKLIIVGPDCGESKNIQKKIKELGLENKVVMTGAILPYRVKNFLGICDIFVLPSLYEGLPLALLEAMAAGKAVVFTDIFSAKRVIISGKNGLLIKPADSKALADALIRLIQNKELRACLGKNAAVSVKKFDSRHEARKMRNRYRRVLAE